MEQIHRLTAAIIYAFLALHLSNHLAGLMGIDTHLQVMGAMRVIYRHPIVELALMLSLLIQLVTGIALCREIWTKKKDHIHQLQAASGALIALFILVHLAHMAYGRYVLHTDTNIYFAAASFSDPNLKYVAYGLYGTGLMALFLHFGCIGYAIFKKTNKPAGYVTLVSLVLIGGIVTWYLLQMLSGHLYKIDIPEDYMRL